MHTVLPSPSVQSGVGTLYQENKYKSMIQAPGTISCVAATGYPLCQSPVVLSHFFKAAWSSLPLLSKPCGSLLGMAAMPGFKSQSQSSSAAPFPTPPTISYTCQHSRILPALLGCDIKSGQVWPRGMKPIFSKLSCRCCNQGDLLVSYILGGSDSHLPGSTHGHSYLTYP